MSVDITQLVMQKYYINKLESEISRDEKRLIEMEDTLRKQCTHPDNYLKTEKLYDSGGYDYVSTVTIRKICSLCDTLIEEYRDPNHHGNYG